MEKERFEVTRSSFKDVFEKSWCSGAGEVDSVSPDLWSLRSEMADSWCVLTDVPVDFARFLEPGKHLAGEIGRVMRSLTC